jgi:hypothetical protein
MESATKTLQIVRMAMLASILLYGFVGEKLPRNSGAAPPDRRLFLALTVVAVALVVLATVLRRALVVKAQSELAIQADDKAALGRWQTGYIASYALCEAIALEGLVLRMLGFSLSQVMPFYLAAFGLILFYAPRRPSDEIR